MKLKAWLLLVFVSTFSFPSISLAAGSWDDFDEQYDRIKGGTFHYVRGFTADAAAATIPSWPDGLPEGDALRSLNGCITRVYVKFDAVTAPDSLIVSITDEYDTPVSTEFPAAAIAASGSVKDPSDGPVCISMPHATWTDNTTNSAEGVVIVDGFYLEDR